MTAKLHPDILKKRKEEQTERREKKFKLSIAKLNLVLVSSYNGAEKPVTLKCILDDHEFTIGRSGDYKRGCPECKRRKKTETFKQKFIEKANKIHNNSYDYSEVNYKNNSTRVVIICKKHGPFEVLPACHTKKKRGCPQCLRENISDSIDFVAKEVLKMGGALVDSMSGNKKYILTEQRIKVECSTCRKAWTPKWRDLKVNKRWCGICTVKYAKSLSFGQLQTLANAESITITKFPNNPVDFLNKDDEVEFICNVCDHQDTKTVRCFTLNSKQKNQQTCSNCSSYRHSRTFEEIEQDLKNHGSSVIKFPNNGKIKKAKAEHIFSIKCPKGHISDNNIHNIYTNGIVRHGRPPCLECSREQQSEKQSMTLEEFLSRAKEKHGDRYDYSRINKDNWKNSRVKVPVICKKHGEWQCFPSTHILRSSGCSKCGYEETAKKQSRTHEEYVVLLKQKNPKVECLEQYVKSQHKILHKCLICDHMWKVVPNSLVIAGRGCPECGKKYYRENWAREVLEEMFGKKFPSVRPDWLKNPKTNRPLELDCYNKELNLALEFQGIQHYQPVEVWGGQEAYDKNIYKDKIKNNICNEKGIILWKIDNRKLKTLQEDEFRKKVEKIILKKAFSDFHTPSWNEKTKLIRKLLQEEKNGKR